MRRKVFDAKKFGRAIDNFTLGVSLRTLARQTGVSASTLSRVKRGKSPDVETLGRVCRWLGLPESVFFKHTP